MSGNAERAIARVELLNEVRGYHNYPTTRIVGNHISKLRRNWNYSLLIQCVRDCSLCWLQVHAAFERTKRFHFCHFCFLSEADGKGNSKESTFGDPRVAGLSGALLSPLSRDGR